MEKKKKKKDREERSTGGTQGKRKDAKQSYAEILKASKGRINSSDAGLVARNQGPRRDRDKGGSCCCVLHCAGQATLGNMSRLPGAIAARNIAMSRVAARALARTILAGD